MGHFGGLWPKELATHPHLSKTLVQVKCAMEAGEGKWGRQKWDATQTNTNPKTHNNVTHAPVPT